MKTINYFAYGSNLLRARLAARVSIVEDCGLHTLGGWQLQFHKRGRDGSGKCDIARHPESSVCGVLYMLDQQAILALDHIEGAGAGYRRISVRLSAAIEAQTYIAEASYIDPSLVPFTWYRDLVIAGAQEHRFPEAYISQHLDIQAVADPDIARDTLNRKLLWL